MYRTLTPHAGRGALLAVLVALLAPLVAVVVTAGPAHAGPTYQEPKVGECRSLDWDELHRWSNKEAPIDCTEPHTSRVIGTGRLPRGVSWDAPEPQLIRITTKICHPLWTEVLGGGYRSRIMTAYSWAWFIPTAAQREQGARWIRCDLMLWAGQTLGTLPAEAALGPEPHPDRIAACMKGETFLVTTCSRRHAWRATGAFIMQQESFPSDREFRRAALRRCPSLVTTDAFAWRHRTALRWRLGDHAVVCYSRTRR